VGLRGGLVVLGKRKLSFLAGLDWLTTVRDFELIPVLTHTRRDHLLIALRNLIFMKLFMEFGHYAV
jgi:hypothetical protein